MLEILTKEKFTKKCSQHFLGEYFLVSIENGIIHVEAYTDEFLETDSPTIIVEPKHAFFNKNTDFYFLYELLAEYSSCLHEKFDGTFEGAFNELSKGVENFIFIAIADEWNEILCLPDGKYLIGALDGWNIREVA